MPETLLAGRVGRAHGLDGSFVVEQPRAALLTEGTSLLLDGEPVSIARRAGTDQRPIVRLEGCDTRAVREGLRLGYESYRDHTPLSGGQVDDTPFGGGAGMVLRVDVVDAAMRAHYGQDPVDLRHSRRVVALTPGGRLLDDALATELAGE